MNIIELEGLKNKFEGFELFAYIEERFFIKPRGGIVILVKRELAEFLTVIPNKSNMVMFCKINKKF